MSEQNVVLSVKEAQIIAGLLQQSEKQDHRCLGNSIRYRVSSNPYMDKLRDVARRRQEDGILDIDAEAAVSVEETDTPEGAYVQAWMWVSNSEVEEGGASPETPADSENEEIKQEVTVYEPDIRQRMRALSICIKAFVETRGPVEVVWLEELAKCARKLGLSAVETSDLP